MVHISCDNGLLFNSLSNGDKWYKQDVGTLIRQQDKIYFANFGDLEVWLPDTVFAWSTDFIQYGQTIADL